MFLLNNVLDVQQIPGEAVMLADERQFFTEALHFFSVVKKQLTELLSLFTFGYYRT